MHPLLGTWPTTQACVLTGNQTGSLLLHSRVLNPLSHSNQGHLGSFITTRVIFSHQWQMTFSREIMGVLQSSVLASVRPAFFGLLEGAPWSLCPLPLSRSPGGREWAVTKRSICSVLCALWLYVSLHLASHTSSLSLLPSCFLSALGGSLHSELTLQSPMFYLYLLFLSFLEK